MNSLFTLLLPFVLMFPSSDVSEFTAVEENNMVNLEWTLKPNHDVAYFKVERSIDNDEYESLSRIRVRGEDKVFSFRDETPFLGVSYYRLRIVNKEGKTKYTEPLYIEVGRGNTVGIPTGAKWRDSNYYYR